MIGKVQIADLAKQAVPELTGAQALAIAEVIGKAEAKAESHELRKARHLRKQVARELGKAGWTIHTLRGEVALLQAQRRMGIHAAVHELFGEGGLAGVLAGIPVIIGGEDGLHDDVPEAPVVDVEPAVELDGDVVKAVNTQ